MTAGRPPGACAAAGSRVHVLDAADLPDALPQCDLVVDAAYGTGFRGEWDAPEVSASGAGR